MGGNKGQIRINEQRPFDPTKLLDRQHRLQIQIALLDVKATHPKAIATPINRKSESARPGMLDDDTLMVDDISA